MASILKVDKLDPQGGTALEIGTSGDTISIPSGATLDISASTLTPPATMPASSGINLTALNATNLGSGTVPTARLGSGTASSSTVLYGDQTYKAEPGGDLTPAFQVTKSAAQTVSHATITKVTWDVETYDTDSAFASDKFTIPAGEGGKYLFYWHLQGGSGDDSDTYRIYSIIYKNGSQANLINLNLAATDGRILNAGATQVLDLSATDYIEIYINIATSSANDIDVSGGSSETSIFGGYKILGA